VKSWIYLYQTMEEFNSWKTTKVNFLRFQIPLEEHLTIRDWSIEARIIPTKSKIYGTNGNVKLNWDASSVGVMDGANVLSSQLGWADERIFFATLRVTAPAATVAPTATVAPAASNIAPGGILW